MTGAQRIVVVGGGVAGLAAARALRRQAPAVEVVVLEAQPRIGGLVESEAIAGGFLVEHGADCLLTTKPQGLAAVESVGLTREIVQGHGVPQSYVAAGARLVPLPSILAGVGPAALLSLVRSSLLTTRGKLRALVEPLVPRRTRDDDESVRAFAARRFGDELATAVVGPLIAGIYGGEVDHLSAAACVPRLRDFERVDGSVTRGTVRAVRARRRRERTGERLTPPVVSMRRGMGSLVTALARGLDCRPGVAVERLARAGASGFRLDTTAGVLGCDGVVLATPAWASARIVEHLAPDLASGLGAIRHGALASVTLAFRREQVPHPLAGTGWVRALGDPRPTLACTWASEKWPNRAPTGFALVRSVLEGVVGDDETLVAAAAADLADLLGVRAEPVLTRVRRRTPATPIYDVGHAARVARLEAGAASLGAVAVAGNAYRGIGIPDCIASGEAAAAAVLAAC